MIHFTENEVYIVTYDISSNKLRRKVDKALKNYGIRIQKSVFACSLNKDQLFKMKIKLRNVTSIDPNLNSPDDSLIVIGNISSKEVYYLSGNNCITSNYMIY